jgi:hypothetical protein
LGKECALNTTVSLTERMQSVDLSEVVGQSVDEDLTIQTDELPVLSETTKDLLGI